MPTVYLCPTFGVGYQAFDSSGLPLNAGLLHTYIAGGTTPQATYTTYLGNVQNANPIVLDADGRTPNEIWLTDAAYRFDLEDSDGNLIASYDNIGGIVDAADLAASGGSAMVGFIQAGANAVARTAQSKMREVVSVKDFGAVGDGVTDDYTAFANATAVIQPWQTLEIPPGEYLLSQTWVWKNKPRSKLVCYGVLKPYSTFSDFLINISNDVNDPLIPSMGLQSDISGLALDCMWQCRGAKIDGLYDSCVENLRVWRPYGNGILIVRIQEVSFINPEIIAGRPRVNSSISSATAWSGATTYAENDYVKVDYAAWDIATAYSAADIVSSGDFIYRALAATTGDIPVSNADLWERIPYQFYQATSLAGNTNKNPVDGSTDYTTRSATAGDRFWKPVYADEAALEIVGSRSTDTIDNAKFWNFVSRSNAQNTIVRMDNPQSTLPVLKVEFFAPQNHAITTVYISAFNAVPAYTTAYGGNIVTPTEGKLIHAVDVSGMKVIGGQHQMGDLDWCKGIICGAVGISGNAARTFLGSTYIEGTTAGENQVGISILPSVDTTGANWFETGLSIVTNSDVAANNHDKVDPKGETETAQSGTAIIAKGDSSIAVVFDPPMLATPEVAVVPKTALNGLSWDVSSVTNAGFTITIRGVYEGSLNTFTVSSGGGSNQTQTWNHGSVLQTDILIPGAPSADVGAGFYLIEGASNANNTVIIAPAAPSTTCAIPWYGGWRNKAPSATNFDWYAVIEPE